MTAVILPQLGEAITEATVLRWIKQIGDDVARDEPLVELDTDKVTLELPAPFAGRLTGVLARQGETVAIGATLAEMELAEGESPVTATVAAAAASPPAPAPPPADAPATASRPLARAGGAARRSPAVRRLAAEHNVDLESIRGSGPGGRITREDVLTATAAAASDDSTGAADSGVVVTLSPMRRRIAEHMLTATRNAPQALVSVEIDVSAIQRARQAAGGDRPPGYQAYVARAICEALRQWPRLNAVWRDDELIQHARINLGIAVDTPDGLIVPVIPDAATLDPAQLADRIQDVASRAQTRSLRLADVEGGTFTLDNSGALGSVFTAPIVNYPQVAILAMDAIVRRPIVVAGDAVAVRPIMNCSLTFDHRAIDGAEAARFLLAVKDGIEGGAL